RPGSLHRGGTQAPVSSRRPGKRGPQGALDRGLGALPRADPRAPDRLRRRAVRDRAHAPGRHRAWARGRPTNARGGPRSPPARHTGRYQMKRITEAARSAPIVTLKIRIARSEARKRWTTAPKASHGKQLGRDASTKVRPKATDWPKALPAPRS